MDLHPLSRTALQFLTSPYAELPSTLPEPGGIIPIISLRYDESLASPCVTIAAHILPCGVYEVQLGKESSADLAVLGIIPVDIPGYTVPTGVHNLGAVDCIVADHPDDDLLSHYGFDL